MKVLLPSQLFTCLIIQSDAWLLRMPRRGSCRNRTASPHSSRNRFIRLAI